MDYEPPAGSENQADQDHDDGREIEVAAQENEAERDFGVEIEPADRAHETPRIFEAVHQATEAEAAQEGRDAEPFGKDLDGRSDERGRNGDDESDGEADATAEVNEDGDAGHQVGELVELDGEGAPPAVLAVVGVGPTTSAGSVEGVADFCTGKEPDGVVGGEAADGSGD